jgi:hypothetical protein
MSTFKGGVEVEGVITVGGGRTLEDRIETKTTAAMSTIIVINKAIMALPVLVIMDGDLTATVEANLITLMEVINSMFIVDHLLVVSEGVEDRKPD